MDSPRNATPTKNQNTEYSGNMCQECSKAITISLSHKSRCLDSSASCVLASTMHLTDWAEVDGSTPKQTPMRMHHTMQPLRSLLSSLGMFLNKYVQYLVSLTHFEVYP